MKKTGLFLSVLFIYAAAHAAKIPSQFSGESLISQKKITVPVIDESKKGLVVLFMSVKCPCSNSHVKLLQQIANENKDFRFLVVHSNPEENRTEAQAYFQNLKFDIEVIQDEKTAIADALGAYKTPHAFVFGPQGNVLYRGGVTNSTYAPSADQIYLRDALDDIKAGHPVKRPEGRTLGCVIAREGDKNVF